VHDHQLANIKHSKSGSGQLPDWGMPVTEVRALVICNQLSTAADSCTFIHSFIVRPANSTAA